LQRESDPKPQGDGCIGSSAAGDVRNAVVRRLGSTAARGPTAAGASCEYMRDARPEGTQRLQALVFMHRGKGEP